MCPESCLSHFIISPHLHQTLTLPLHLIFLLFLLFFLFLTVPDSLFYYLSTFFLCFLFQTCLWFDSILNSVNRLPKGRKRSINLSHDSWPSSSLYSLMWLHTSICYSHSYTVPPYPWKKTLKRQAMLQAKEEKSLARAANRKWAENRAEIQVWTRDNEQPVRTAWRSVTRKMRRYINVYTIQSKQCLFLMFSQIALF